MCVCFTKGASLCLAHALTLGKTMSVVVIRSFYFYFQFNYRSDVPYACVAVVIVVIVVAENIKGVVARVICSRE